MTDAIQFNHNIDTVNYAINISRLEIKPGDSEISQIPDSTADIVKITIKIQDDEYNRWLCCYDTDNIELFDTIRSAFNNEHGLMFDIVVNDNIIVVVRHAIKSIFYIKFDVLKVDSEENNNTMLKAKIKALEDELSTLKKYISESKPLVGKETYEIDGGGGSLNATCTKCIPHDNGFIFPSFKKLLNRLKTFCVDRKLEHYNLFVNVHKGTMKESIIIDRYLDITQTYKGLYRRPEPQSHIGSYHTLYNYILTKTNTIASMVGSVYTTTEETFIDTYQACPYIFMGLWLSLISFEKKIKIISYTVIKNMGSRYCDGKATPKQKYNDIRYTENGILRRHTKPDVTGIIYYYIPSTTYWYEYVYMVDVDTVDIVNSNPDMEVVSDMVLLRHRY